jgi:hypothetical protein
MNTASLQRAPTSAIRRPRGTHLAGCRRAPVFHRAVQGSALKPRGPNAECTSSSSEIVSVSTTLLPGTSDDQPLSL